MDRRGDWKGEWAHRNENVTAAACRARAQARTGAAGEGKRGKRVLFYKGMAEQTDEGESRFSELDAVSMVVLSARDGYAGRGTPDGRESEVVGWRVDGGEAAKVGAAPGEGSRACIRHWHGDFSFETFN
ncbi:hypothetical protein E2562_001061 [Oryza meyeriana var. granulata]|uniref:Uncharacterized protein n=1 Tax=Oryza meyeriana var. granulata TaxID=110450 RepID=A0A6G1EFE5_9ORYZ|nr:hypothetical protein E2562_001061 [Oryza meyeriana var. granulata]